DPALLERLLAAGPIRLVTLAPELPGADALVALLHDHGITVSCGHTNATAEEAEAAFDLGVRTVTHLFNAMRPFPHRDPRIAGAGDPGRQHGARPRRRDLDCRAPRRRLAGGRRRARRQPPDRPRLRRRGGACRRLSLPVRPPPSRAPTFSPRSASSRRRC